MTTREIFRRIVAALESAEIPYMVTGSFASSYHGTPRATQDIDIVIAPTLESLDKLLKAFPESKYYVSTESAHEALSKKSLFNLIDNETGWKVDFIIQKGRPFSQEEFKRRIQIELFGTQLYVASAEDVILSKMEWAAASESDRQINDVAGILSSRPQELDQEYLEHWIRELALEQEWRKAKKLSGP